MVNPVQTLYLDDADFPVKPRFVYSTEKLVRAYTGNSMRIRNFADNTNHEVPFVGTSISVASDITPFVGAGPDDAATVTVWYDQMQRVNAIKSLYRAPKIKNKTVGKPAIIFEGGSQQGKAYGLDLPITTQGLGGQNWTVFAVMRPTSSAPRNQNYTPNVGDGTVVSWSATLPIAVTGTATIGQSTITVSSAAGVFPNMVITGPSFPDGALVLGVVGNVINVFGLAEANSVAANYKISNPLARCFMNGGGASGTVGTSFNQWGYAHDDGLNVNLRPSTQPMEIGPSVVTWRMGNSGSVKEVPGTSIFQNERKINNGLISSKGNAGVYGFIGVHSGTLDIADTTVNNAGRNKAGDFWISALVIYNSTLTDEECAYIRSALYDRMGIPEARSRVGNKTTIWAMGDSIPAGYVCLGIDGMFNQVQDLNPLVRIYNYCVPGSQITGTGFPIDNTFATVGMYTASVAPQLSRVPTKKIVIVLGGGNDMVSEDLTMADHVTPFAFASFVGTLATTTAPHGLVVGGRIKFLTNAPGGTDLISTYWVKTTPLTTTFTISATEGGAAINFATNPAATMKSLPKTAASIYAGITTITNAAFARGAKVFVCTSLPRVGTEYLGINPALNTLIAAGAVANNYTTIDTFALFPNHNNPVGTIDTVNFADSGHPNRVGHVVAGNAISAAIASSL